MYLCVYVTYSHRKAVFAVLSEVLISLLLGFKYS